MATGINRHEFKKIVKTWYVYHSRGYKNLFWGLIKIPQGWYEKKERHFELCIRCGEKERTSNHGYFKLTEL